MIKMVYFFVSERIWLNGDKYIFRWGIHMRKKSTRLAALLLAGIIASMTPMEAVRASNTAIAAEAAGSGGAVRLSTSDGSAASERRTAGALVSDVSDEVETVSDDVAAGGAADEIEEGRASGRAGEKKRDPRDQSLNTDLLGLSLDSITWKHHKKENSAPAVRNDSEQTVYSLEDYFEQKKPGDLAVTFRVEVRDNGSGGAERLIAGDTAEFTLPYWTFRDTEKKEEHFVTHGDKNIASWRVRDDRIHLTFLPAVEELAESAGGTYAVSTFTIKGARLDQEELARDEAAEITVDLQGNSDESRIQKINLAGRFAPAEKADETDTADQTDEIDEADERDRTDEIDEADEEGKTDGIDESDEKDETDDTGKTDDANKTDDKDKVDGKDKTDDKDKTDTADQIDDTDKADDTDQTDKTDNSDEIDQPDAADSAAGATKAESEDAAAGATDASAEVGEDGTAATKESPEKAAPEDGAAVATEAAAEDAAAGATEAAAEAATAGATEAAAEDAAVGATEASAEDATAGMTDAAAEAATAPAGEVSGEGATSQDAQTREGQKPEEQQMEVEQAEEEESFLDSLLGVIMVPIEKLRGLLRGQSGDEDGDGEENGSEETTHTFTLQQTVYDVDEVTYLMEEWQFPTASGEGAEPVVPELGYYFGDDAENIVSLVTPVTVVEDGEERTEYRVSNLSDVAASNTVIHFVTNAEILKMILKNDRINTIDWTISTGESAANMGDVVFLAEDEGTHLQSIEIEVQENHRKKQTFKKNWLDGTSKEARPSVTELYLEYQMGAEVGTENWYRVTDEAAAVIGMDNIPSFEGFAESDRYFLDLRPHAKKNGQEIRYRLAETMGDEVRYVSSYPEEDEGRTLDNTLIKPYHATVKWADAGNKYRTRGAQTDLTTDAAKAEAEEWFVNWIQNCRMQKSTVAGTWEVELTLDDPNAEGYVTMVPVEDEGDESCHSWTITLPNARGFDENNFPFSYAIFQKNDIQVRDTSIVNDGSRYTAKYENQNNYASIENGLYNGGTLTDTLENTTDFDITKQWKDGGRQELRPKTTMTLYRYPDDGVANWSTASPVPENEIVHDVARDTDEIIPIHYNGPYPKYDPNGYMYLYFVKEKMEGNVDAVS